MANQKFCTADALHKARLLNVEEKPFKRIVKRLLGPNSLLTTIPTLPPTPPPDASAADEEAAATERERKQIWDERKQFREDVLLDFAAFESSIVRMQIIHNTNAKERERYAAEKLKIEATAQEVRKNNAELRVKLEEAQKTLALRKTYDELAEKITSNRLLRPREDQNANLLKLNAEIAELEQESRDYARTWAERRAQFGRIIEEGMQLRRQIRDEKEEVERREGMEERDEAEEGDVGSRPSGTATPRHEVEGTTPLHPGSGLAADGHLTVDGHQQPSGKSPLHSSEHIQDSHENGPENGDDVDMAEDGEISVDGEGDAVAAPPEGLIAGEKEGGRDQMDTSS